jgi:hypothetical protein
MRYLIGTIAVLAAVASGVFAIVGAWWIALAYGLFAAFSVYAAISIPAH